MTDPLPNAVDIRSVASRYEYRIRLDGRIIKGNAPTPGAARTAALEVFDTLFDGDRAATGGTRAGVAD